MKRRMGLGAVLVVVLASGVASAEDRRASRVYDDTGLDKPSAIAREVASMEKACAFYDSMSRMGPDPKAVAVCDQAVSKVERRGPAAAGLLLASVDKGNSWYVKQRAYQLIGKSGDTRLIESLVRGLARIATRKLEREDEIGMIDAALAELTHASPDARAPWDAEAPVSAEPEAAVARVFEWRIWHEQHRNVSHAELAARALEQARAGVASSDPRKAYEGVTHLLRYVPEEGLLAAPRVLAGGRLPEEGRAAVADAVTQIENAKEEAEALRVYKADAEAQLREELQQKQQKKNKARPPRAAPAKRAKPSRPDAKTFATDPKS
jgi:hypothetical protein